MTQGNAALSHSEAEKMLSTHLVHTEDPSGVIPNGGIKPHLGEAEQSRVLVRIRFRQKAQALCQPLSQDRHCPERSGYFPRQWGPLKVSCLLQQCWLQEFLDPLPKHVGCPLKVLGEGFGSI